MHQLSPKEWSHLEATISLIRTTSSLEEFEHIILEELPIRIGSFFATWNEHNESMLIHKMWNSSNYQEQVLSIQEDLNSSIGTHPLFPHYFDFQSGTVRYVETVERTRDHTTDEGFHASEFYQKVASKLDIEDQVLMHIGIENGAGTLLIFQYKNLVTPEIHLQAAILRGHIISQYHLLQKQQLTEGERARKRFKTITDELSNRETSVFIILCTGKSNSEIADELGISKRTVDKHIENILRKLNTNNRNRLIAEYGSLVPYLIQNK